MHKIPSNLCSKLEIEHHDPNHNIATSVFYLFISTKTYGDIEKCTPQEDRCYPNLENLRTIAGTTKKVVLYSQNSLELYKTECSDALFDLKDAPSWISLEDSAILVIDAPNHVTVVGNQTITIQVWDAIITVEAPCD